MSSPPPPPPPSLLTRLGDVVRSINPTLVTDPPPPTEVTGRDVCYLGAGGEAEGDDVVYCRDLADGLRPMVGSWYLSAERHVVEYVVATLLWLLVLRLVIPRLSPHRPPPPYFISTLSDDSDNEEKVTGDESTGFSLRPPKPLRLITYVVCTLMVSYKALGYPGKLYFLLMPCNVNWLVALLLCLADVDSGNDAAGGRDDRRKTTRRARPWFSLGRNGGNALLQCGIGWSGLALVALVTPDTSDLTLPCEVAYFFTSHAVLMAFPFVFLLTNQVSTLPHPDDFGVGGGCSRARAGWNAFTVVASHFAKWFVVTLATFSLFYVAVVTPLSIWTGLNLNYMLSPPPNPGDLVGGENYRIVSCFCVASVFFVMRFLTTLVEYSVRAALRSPKYGRSRGRRTICLRAKKVE